MTDDDLVRRLLVGACAQNDVAWSLMRAAADRIEALTAEHNATLARLAGAVAREIALTADNEQLVQTSAIYCNDCGWAMKFPDCGCVYCGFHRLEKERDALTAERDYTEGTNDTLIALNQSLTADNAQLRAALEEIGLLQARVEDQAREIADLTRQLQGQPRRPQDVAGVAQKGAEP